MIIDGVDHCIVIAVADAAYRGLNVSFNQTFDVFDLDILAGTVTVTDQAATMSWPTVMASLLQRIENGTGIAVRLTPITHDLAGVHIDHARTYKKPAHVET